MQKESRKIMSTTLYVRALQLGQGEKERWRYDAKDVKDAKDDD